jgi:hypothetical protein
MLHGDSFHPPPLEKAILSSFGATLTSQHKLETNLTLQACSLRLPFSDPAALLRRMLAVYLLPLFQGANLDDQLKPTARLTPQKLSEEQVW